MTKHRTFKKIKPGEPILVTALELESFMLEHKDKFNSHEYDKFEHMELTRSPVRDAVHKLKTYSLEILAQRFDVRLLGRGKRVFARLDSEDDDDTWCHFSLAYIPRALNNRDVNDAIVRYSSLASGVSTSSRFGQNRKTLPTLATISIKHSANSSIDSIYLIVAGF